MPDDNRLLAALRAANFLLPKPRLTGYAPAALFFRGNGENFIGSNVELFVGESLGEKELTQNGGAQINYFSLHAIFHTFFDSLTPDFTIASGEIVETVEPNIQRLFLPSAAESAIEWDEQTKRNMADELGRHGIVGVGSELDFKWPSHGLQTSISLTGALREAAQWAEYTVKPPYFYPRTLGVDEADLCLKEALQKIMNDTPFNNRDIVEAFVSSR